MCSHVTLCACLNVLFLQISGAQAPIASLRNPCVTKCEEFVGGIEIRKIGVEILGSH